MKHAQSMLFAVLGVFTIGGCATQWRQEQIAGQQRVTLELCRRAQAWLDVLDADLATLEEAVAPVMDDRDAVRKRLSPFARRPPGLLCASVTDPQGVVQLIEPADLAQLEGTKAMDELRLGRLHDNRAPVMDRVCHTDG